MRLWLLGALLLVACDGEALGHDAGAADAAAPGDATLTDAAPLVDAPADDAGRDAGEADAGPPGACDPADSPTPNAGLSEAPGAGGCLPVMRGVVGMYRNFHFLARIADHFGEGVAQPCAINANSSVFS